MSSTDEQQQRIVTIVASYWVISISMVYLNKALMSSEGLSINAPLFVTFFQCVVTTIICWVCGLVGKTFSGSTSSAPNPTTTFFKQFPLAEYDTNVGRQVLPLSFVFVGMITFNNLCLKWVEVSFYNVARSLTVVFNVFLTFFLLGTPSSTNTLLCLGVVCIGFIIGSGGEMNFSVLGTTAGVFSSLFVSLNSIFTKKILPFVGDNHWKLTFYNNVNACVLFIPLILIFEFNTLVAAMDDQFLQPEFWLAMTAAGFFGFAIGIVTVLQIKATSPLTHNISGTAKAALQSIMAFYIWGNPATFMGVMGIATVLGGSLAYTYVKMEEGKAPPLGK